MEITRDQLVGLKFYHLNHTPQEVNTIVSIKGEKMEVKWHNDPNLSNVHTSTNALEYFNIGKYWIPIIEESNKFNHKCIGVLTTFLEDSKEIKEYFTKIPGINTSLVTFNATGSSNATYYLISENLIVNCCNYNQFTDYQKKYKLYTLNEYKQAINQSNNQKSNKNEVQRDSTTDRGIIRSCPIRSRCSNSRIAIGPRLGNNKISLVPSKAKIKSSAIRKTILKPKCY